MRCANHNDVGQRNLGTGANSKQYGDLSMQSTVNQQALWLCPNCGVVAHVALHPNGVKQRKQISIRPILPACATCGAEVRLHHPPAHRTDTRLIVLTGTCASGKSTTAEVLIAGHGFHGIDGNCVRDVLQHKYGRGGFAFNGVEMVQEIAQEIDILLALQKDIVLSHVIVPEDLHIYREMFLQRGLHYKIFVLQPRYAAAVSRSEERHGYQPPTAQEWVKHFHDAMRNYISECDVVIFDNTDLSVRASTEMILQLYQAEEGSR